MNTLKCAIIEDNKEFSQLVDWIMGDENRVKFFKEVSDFTDEGFDVVFCDLRLTETWGVDTVKALRPKTKAAIIVLTGLGTAPANLEDQAGPSTTFLTGLDHVSLIEAGADEVFLKDKVQDPHFADLVKQVISRKREHEVQTS